MIEAKNQCPTCKKHKEKDKIICTNTYLKNGRWLFSNCDSYEPKPLPNQTQDMSKIYKGVYRRIFEDVQQELFQKVKNQKIIHPKLNQAQKEELAEIIKKHGGMCKYLESLGPYKTDFDVVYEQKQRIEALETLVNNRTQALIDYKKTVATKLTELIKWVEVMKFAPGETVLEGKLKTIMEDLK